MTLPESVPDPFAPVSEDELAFALAYFVGAAERKFGASGGQPPVPLDLDDACNRLFAFLYRTQAPETSTNPDPPPCRNCPAEATLLDTFKAVCLQYHGTPHLVPVCARVMAFYLLMERTAGAAVTGWSDAVPEDERYISLTRPVIQAMASLPLGRSVHIDLPVFLIWLQRYEHERAGVQ